jgi:hypothetical protein
MSLSKLGFTKTFDTTPKSLIKPIGVQTVIVEVHENKQKELEVNN